MRRQAAIAASLALALSIGACGGGTSGDATYDTVGTVHVYANV